MKAKHPMSKAELIQCSLRCFAFGIFGLLPIIGIPLALHSVILYRRARGGQGDLWNPAGRYLFWGGVCARMSLAIFVLIPIAVMAIGSLTHLF
jgi:hypothetical protein